MEQHEHSADNDVAKDVGDDLSEAAAPEVPLHSGEVRIAAPGAAVAAGTAQEEPAEPLTTESPMSLGPDTEAYELQDWVDPPTGQVPRVLLENPEAQDLGEPILRGPTWREEGADWDDDLDLSFLVSEEDETGEIAGRVEPSEAPFEFAFAELDEELQTEDTDEHEAAWMPLFDVASTPANARRRHRRPVRAHRAPAPSGRRSVAKAVVTGVIFAVAAIICFILGSQATVALVAVVATVAAGEAFAALRTGGFRPATLVGILAVPVLVVAAYQRGPEAVVDVFAVAVVLIGLWQLSPLGRGEAIMNAGATVFVVAWIGVLAAFAGLLLAPATFPHRHGVAFVLAVVVLTASYDIGAYAIGAKFGRHRVAPVVSPQKSVEGLVGGAIAALGIGAIAISRLHPFDLRTALALGAIVSVLAPLGDLVESLVKRDLDIKDMGSLLPAHGGFLDRVDAMLFVLLPTYLLVRGVHIG